MIKKLLLCLVLVLPTVLYADGNIGNIVRDVQGAPYAIFRCTASEPILKWDATLTPPRFKCSAEASGGSITVEDDDSNPTYSSITTLQFDQDDGFTISNPGAGIVKIDITHDGVGYDEVLDEASGLTKRAKINFIGSLVTCADDAGNTRTNCTFTVPTNALLDGSSHTDTTNSAVTKGDLIYGNSTPAWDDLAIGAEGQALRVSAGVPAWKNLPTPYNINYTSAYFDDFTCQAASLATSSVTVNSIGDWHGQSSGTGAIASCAGGGNTIAGGGSGIESGSFKAEMGSSTGGEACIWREGPMPWGAGNGIDTTTRGKLVFQFRFHTAATLSTVGDRYYFIIGANNAASCNLTDTSGSFNAMIVYSDAVNSGKFQGITKTAAGTSTCDTAVTVATDTTYKGCIVFNSDATQVDFYITSTMSALDCTDPDNITGTAACSISTCNNIPGCNGSGGQGNLRHTITMNKTAGTNTGFVWYTDYFYFLQQRDTTR